MTTLRELRQAAYDDPVIGPALGFYGVATSVTGLTLTDPAIFGTQFGRTHFAGKGTVVLPGRVGSDREKEAGTLAGDVMTVLSTVAYTAAFTDEPWEFIRGGMGPESITLARLNAAAVNAVRRVYFDTRTPHGLWEDSDLSETSATSWLSNTSASNLQIEKSAASAHNRTGFQSLKLTYNVPSVYVYSALGYDCAPRDQFWIAGLPIIVSGGPVTMRVWDDTNNVQIGDDMVATGLGPKHMGDVFTAPDGCYKINMRLYAEDGTVVAWDAFPSHDLAAMNFTPPSWVDANWKLYGLDIMAYGRQIADHVENANTMNPVRWYPGKDYTTANLAEESSPNEIQILPEAVRGRVGQVPGYFGRRAWSANSLPAQDIWYYGRRRESDRVAFDADTDNYLGDFDYLIAAFFEEICGMLAGAGYPGGPWRDLKAGYARTVNANRFARQPMTPTPDARHRRMAV